MKKPDKLTLKILNKMTENLDGEPTFRYIPVSKFKKTDIIKILKIALDRLEKHQDPDSNYWRKTKL